MQNKILIDNFDYRFQQKDSSVSFANPGPENLKFSENERQYYISKILNSLLIHDAVVFRITSIFDLVQLFGLEEVKILLQNKLIEIIDDGGIVKLQRLEIRDDRVYEEEEIDMIRVNNFFKPNDIFRLDKIEEKFTNKFSGKVINNHTKPLIQLLEESKININGESLVDDIIKETDNDINSSFVKNLVQPQTKSNSDFHLIDFITVNTISSINRALAYQLHLKIKDIHTDNFARHLILSKLSPLFQKNRQLRNIELFERIISLKKIPDIATLYINGHLNIQEIIKIRKSFDAIKFRSWISSFEGTENDLIQEMIKAEPKLSKLVKLIRFIVPELFNLSLPGIGKPIKILDSLYLDRLYKLDWHPNFFIDNRLLEITRKKENESFQKIRVDKFIARFGRIGRNDKCPCGSGKKYKKCHGR